MTDRNQFEAMLEALINEDQETAKEIFHNIVVAKSREIYEELLSEDFDLEESNKDPEEPEDQTEAFGADDSEEEPADDSEEPADDSEDDVGGDATDDFIGDVDGEEEEDDSEEGEGDMEDRVMDLEDALEELKAEFEQLMAGEEGEPEMGGDDMGMDAEPEMDGGMGGMDSEEPVDELQRFMEYVDKVSLPKHGDNGANTKSIVAGKNDMGGTTANIAKSFSTEKGGTQGGLAKPNPTVNDAGNINKPGGNAGKTAFKKKEPGHGAEKKGSGESADIKSSLIGSRK
jgi:hypothetical protein